MPLFVGVVEEAKMSLSGNKYGVHVGLTKPLFLPLLGLAGPPAYFLLDLLPQNVGKNTL